MTDPIADLLARLKNAFMARHSVVRIPHSHVKKAILDLLAQGGYIESVVIEPVGKFQELVVSLKYIGKMPAITDVRRLSKPGRRLYASSKQLPKTLGGYGVTIVSTSKGVMTDDMARKQNVGGELICQVW